MSDGLDALFEGLPPRLSTEDVAELLGMTKQNVYFWLRDGTIPAYKLGNSWFILRDDLKATMRAGSNLTGKKAAAEEPPEGDEG